MASSNGPSQHDKFNAVIIELAEVLEETVSRLYGDGLTEVTPRKIQLVIGFLNGLKDNDPETLINTFISYSTEPLNESGATCWNQIVNRDEEFFEENCQQIFRDVPLADSQKHISTFRMLFTTHFVTKEAKFVVRSGEDGYDTANPINPDDEWRIGQHPHGSIVIMPGEAGYETAEPIISSSLRFVLAETKFAVEKSVDGARPVLDDEEKQIIWEYFDALIKISIGYVHQKRGPSTVVDEETGKRKATYTTKFLPGLKGLNGYAKLFGVKLKWT